MTKLKDGMSWFKQTFGAEIGPAVSNTPYTLNFLTAIAVQESFEIWGNIFKSLPLPKILELCVGDTIDAPSRKAFPKNRADLLSIPKGAQIFAVARSELEAVGEYNAAYHKIAASNPNKFCHGFGIFQYDIQACKTDPNYFINRDWADFSMALEKCISELKAAQTRAHLGAKTKLSDEELIAVAIAYNAGSYNPKKKLKQGHKDGSGKYYGELIAQYLALASQVP
jgi:hypothetical protein